MSTPEKIPSSNLDALRVRGTHRDDNDGLASTHRRRVMKQDDIVVNRPEQFNAPNAPSDLKDMEKVRESDKMAYWTIGSLSCMALAVSFGSSVFSTAMVLTAKEFKVSPQYMLFGLSVYVIGIACGKPSRSITLKADNW